MNMEANVSARDAQGQDYRTLPLSTMRAILNRFQERVNAAQAINPPTKDWVRKAVRGGGASRCPLRLGRMSIDITLQYGDALADLFCQYPDDVVFAQAYDIAIGFQPPDKQERISTLAAMTQAAEWTDEWGTRWGHAFGGSGATPVDIPIKDWSQLDDYLANRIPDPHAPGRLDGAQRTLALHGETKYCVGLIHLMLFERLHCLRGMENTFSDFYESEAEVTHLLEALAEYAIGLVQEWGKTNVSALFLTDDWGSQTGMMISPSTWRKFFKAHYRRIFDEVHRWGKDVFFHSCGNVMAIVPELIEVGVDALDPIQPGPMDLSKVAQQFGGQVSFCGAIDVQHLATYSPQEVTEAVRRAVDTLGRPFGNGYVVGPANMVVPPVPLENLEALFEACHTQ